MGGTSMSVALATERGLKNSARAVPYSEYSSISCPAFIQALGQQIWRSVGHGASIGLGREHLTVVAIGSEACWRSMWGAR